MRGVVEGCVRGLPEEPYAANPLAIALPRNLALEAGRHRIEETCALARQAHVNRLLEILPAGESHACEWRCVC